MKFYCYSPSETFVVLTADQFVGRDDGLLQQQRHNSSIPSDEGLALETSAFESLYGG